MAATPFRKLRSWQTKPIRRTFSSRSSFENPSPFERFVRTTSPSSSSTRWPRRRSSSLTSVEMVDLPAPERTVNQRVKPSLTWQLLLWRANATRFAIGSRATMLPPSGADRSAPRGHEGSNGHAIWPTRAWTVPDAQIAQQATRSGRDSPARPGRRSLTIRQLVARSESAASCRRPSGGVGGAPPRPILPAAAGRRGGGR